MVLALESSRFCMASAWASLDGIVGFGVRNGVGFGVFTLLYGVGLGVFGGLVVFGGIHCVGFGVFGGLVVFGVPHPASASTNRRRSSSCSSANSLSSASHIFISSK